MNEIVQQLQETASQVTNLCAALPEASLLPGDRQILGGHLLPCGPAVVDLVAEVLRREAALFSDIPIAAADLAARQAEADGWLRLRTVLLGLAQQAADRHLVAQADATRAALMTLDHV
jgi:hypothetical protein